MRKAGMVALVSCVGFVLAGVAVGEDRDRDIRRAPKAAGIVQSPSLNPSGPMLTVVPSKNVITPGETVTVEVFVQNVAQLRAIQVSLDVTGGNSGELTRESVTVDQARNDYVFAANEAVQAADMGRGRAVSALYTGSIPVKEPAYVATFQFRASPDATGTFQIQASKGHDSGLRAGSQQPVEFDIAAAQIVINARK